MIGVPTTRNQAGAGSVPLPPGDVFTPKQLAEHWQLSEQSIRRLFQDRAGVFKLGEHHRGKRPRITIRIPATVAAAVFQERAR